MNLILIHLPGAIAVTGVLCLVLGTQPVLADSDRAVVATDAVTIEPSPLATLVAYLNNATAAERAEFARIAVTVIRDTYVEELEKSVEILPVEKEARAKLARWRSATWEFVAELTEVIRKIDTGARVDVLVGHRDQVQILVDDRSVLLTGPRIKDSDRLVGQVVEAYCRSHSCEGEPRTQEPRPQELRRQKPPDGSWTIGAGLRASFATSDGLIFEFEDIQQRASKERACMVAVRELRSLAASLKEAHRVGYMIEWDVVRLTSAGVGDENRVIINRRGQYLQLPVPSLGRSTALWRRAVPWLRAQALGIPYQQRLPADLVLQADLVERE